MQHPFPSFSTWFVNQRKNTTQRDFALDLGIDTSTVSRTERGKNDTTFETVVHVCNGLQLSCSDFLQSWYPTAEQYAFVHSPLPGPPLWAALSRADILRWQRAIVLDEPGPRILLVSLLNHILAKRKDSPTYAPDRLPVFAQGDIDKVLWRLPGLRLAFLPPLSQDGICHMEEIYWSGGGFLALEIGAWACQQREKERLSFAEIKERSHLSSSALDVFEAKGPGPRFSFLTLLTFDTALKAQGRLFAFAWRECLDRQLSEHVWRSWTLPFPYSLEGMHALRALLISVERWLQVLYPQTFSTWRSLITTELSSSKEISHG